MTVRCLWVWVSCTHCYRLWLVVTSQLPSDSSKQSKVSKSSQIDEVNHRLMLQMMILMIDRRWRKSQIECISLKRTLLKVDPAGLLQHSWFTLNCEECATSQPWCDRLNIHQFPYVKLSNRYWTVNKQSQTIHDRDVVNVVWNLLIVLFIEFV